MNVGADDPRVSEALAELQLYLSDAIAPLVVTDSITVLLAVPPPVVAREIFAWTTSQHRRIGGNVPISDYLYHAMRKLYVMGDLTLVPKEKVESFLDAVKPYVLEFCPEEDRDLLHENLSRLGDTRADLAAPMLGVQSVAGGEGSLAPAGRGAAIKTTVHAERRFTQLVDRLARLQIPVVAEGQPVASGEVATQLVFVAAKSAADADEFQQFKARLRAAGMGATMDDAFRSLGRRLPGWALPSLPEAEGAAAPVPATVQAMARIITLEQDPREVARRLQQLVEAAIEQHNDGSLPRAVTMLDLAAALLAEKKVDPAYVQSFREQAHERLDAQRLRAAAEDPASHPLLRRMLSFFPALDPEGLLHALQTEEKREQRRQLLALLEVHGAPARALAASRLADSIASFGDRDAHFQRNLLHVLRRIPRPDDVAIDPELQIAVDLSGLGHATLLAKEAIAYLGQAKDERSERALIARVAEYETALTRPGSSAHSPAELVAVLDRAVFALARLGTPAAIRAVVHHGLKRLPQLGNTGGRLAALAGVDLSVAPDAVGQLVEAINGELPRRIFGFMLKREDGPLLPLIEALSSTQSPAVRSALADIVQRFPGEAFAQAAARVLAGTEVTVAATAPAGGAAASLSGDLELFGFPTLLQNLSQSRASGTLTISDPAGDEIAAVDLEGGKFHTCRAGRLHGEVGLFQLIERPAPASFTFVSRPDPAPAPDPSGMRDLVPLFFEGARRYDELQQACALVPDYACLRASGSRPTAPPEEDDQELMRAVWGRAVSGAPALECESEAAVDSYRVRRMLAHWVEEGALEPK